MNYSIDKKSNLFHKVRFANFEIPIFYKNIINLSQAELKDSSPIDMYIKDIEKEL
ncbi:hypothetical protein ACFLY2_00405 [Patescibacteria group bacterium]